MAYQKKANTTRISATSRSSVKVQENFYTIECLEERSIPDIEGVDMEKEWTLLFDDLNKVVDNQIAQIIQVYGKKK